MVKAGMILQAMAWRSYTYYFFAVLYFYTHFIHTVSDIIFFPSDDHFFFSFPSSACMIVSLVQSTSLPGISCLIIPVVCLPETDYIPLNMPL